MIYFLIDIGTHQLGNRSHSGPEISRHSLLYNRDYHRHSRRYIIYAPFYLMNHRLLVSAVHGASSLHNKPK